MQQRVRERDVDRVRRKVGQAMGALMNVDDATAGGLFVRAKQQLGVARGAISGIERLLDEMEFRAQKLERASRRS